MNHSPDWSRREFLVGAAALSVLPPGWLSRPPRAPLRVNADRLLATLHGLKRFGATAEGGISRVAFSQADLDGRAYMQAAMVRAGLEVHVDSAGNLVGVRPGNDPSLPPIAMGSHLDSVPEGGNYDGQVGVVAAVEAAHALTDHGVRLRHPLEVFVFPNEEGGKTGSRALAGEVGAEELDLVTASGFTIGEGLRRLGGDPDGLDAARRAPDSLHAFLELHIEQGGVLEREGFPIGVVEGIVGIRRWTVTVEGHQNHAGTTPMADRRDALVAAAELIIEIHHIMNDTPGTHVGTVGRLSAEPGAPNVIPGRVVHTLEIRDLTMEKIDQLFATVEGAAARLSREHQVEIGFEPFYVSYAAPTAEPLRLEIEAATEALGLPRMRMPSGAGHDAQSMAKLGPIGMIFVPSREGISHAPAEFTADEHVVQGAEVLLNTVLGVDAL